MKKKSLKYRVTSLVLSGLLFGSVAGTTSYAVNNYLSSDDETESVQLTTSDTSTLVLTSSTTETSSTASVSDIAAAGLPSVVSVTNISVQEVQQQFFGGMPRGMGGSSQTQTTETTSCGSGVIVYEDDSYLYIVTNYHVIEDATTLSITFVDEETYEAEVVSYDEDRDIAVVKVSKSDMSSDTLESIAIAAVGSSDDLIVGEQVVAIGNALGYGQSVTTGIVSALNRTVDEDSDYTYIQTDAAINPGNSGGALFNMNGELIGINTAKVSSTEVEGMGYAIPISEIKAFIESAIAGE